MKTYTVVYMRSDHQDQARIWDSVDYWCGEAEDQRHAAERAKRYEGALWGSLLLVFEGDVSSDLSYTFIDDWSDDND